MPTDITKRFNERQLKALRIKYTDKEIQLLCDRWEDKLLDPKTFERDENGKIIDKDKAEILKTDLEDCNTFQQLLSKRLKDIEKKLKNSHKMIALANLRNDPCRKAFIQPRLSIRTHPSSDFLQYLVYILYIASHSYNQKHRTDHY